MAQANGNGNGHSHEDQPKRSRRRAKPPEFTVVLPDDDHDRDDGREEQVYDSRTFKEFMRRYESAQSELHQAQAELRELYKAETDRGLNRAAAKILNDKMSAVEAYENLDAIRTLLDWMGHDIEAEGDLVRRAEEAATSPPV